MLMAFLTVWHMKTWRRSSLPGEVTDAVDLLLGTYGTSVYVASMFIYHAEALNGWRLFGVYRIGSAISSILSFHGAFHFNIGTLSKIARKKEEDLGASVSLLRAPHTVILSHRRKKKQDYVALNLNILQSPPIKCIRPFQVNSGKIDGAYVPSFILSQILNKVTVRVTSTE